MSVGLARRLLVPLQVDTALRLEIASQLYGQIVLMVLRNQLRPGDRLDTITTVAQELEIARVTVAKSYRKLQLRGVIETHKRAGSQVAQITSFMRDRLEDEEYEKYLLSTSCSIWLSGGMSMASVHRYHDRVRKSRASLKAAK